MDTIKKMIFGFGMFSVITTMWDAIKPVCLYALVQLADIFEPDPSSRYFVELNNDKNLLVQSGIATATPELTEIVLGQGGKFVDMPFWDDLPHDTGTDSRSKVVTDDTTEITPDKLTTDTDIAVKMFRAQSWEAAAIVKHVAGDDPVGRMIERQANWWNREEQRFMLQILQGIFKTGGALISTHQHDIAIEDGDNAAASNKISSIAINEARFKLGDAFDRLTGMIMHSTVLKGLDNLGLIDFLNGPKFIDNLTGAEMRMPTYGNVIIFTDDTMTNVAGLTSGFKYSTYLFGAGAFARVKIPVSQFAAGAAQNEVVLVQEEKEGTGAGTSELVSRWYGVLHPRGIKFVATVTGTGPTDAQLVAAASWTKVWLDKNIRIAELITNG